MDLAGSKLRKKMGSTLQESASAPTSAFAVKQLEKMGWTEGTGLGKKRNGITTHIKVKKRVEGSGIGTEKQAIQTMKATESWWKDSLGDTLERLASKTKKKKKSGKRKREFTDEELFEATGGARFGMRAMPTRNLSKWRRTEVEIGESNDAPGATTTDPQSLLISEGKVRKATKKDKKKRKGKRYDAVVVQTETTDDPPSVTEKRSHKKRKKGKKKSN